MEQADGVGVDHGNVVALVHKGRFVMANKVTIFGKAG